jgi:hypothetical protein
MVIITTRIAATCTYARLSQSVFPGHQCVLHLPLKATPADPLFGENSQQRRGFRDTGESNCFLCSLTTSLRFHSSYAPRLDPRYSSVHYRAHRHTHLDILHIPFLLRAHSFPQLLFGHIRKRYHRFEFCSWEVDGERRVGKSGSFIDARLPTLFLSLLCTSCLHCLDLLTHALLDSALWSLTPVN